MVFLLIAPCDSFPYKIGYDCAGTVAEIGSQVTRFKVGDEVFARLPECHRGIFYGNLQFNFLVTNPSNLNPGAWSELARTTEDFVALKPNSLSMEDSASIPLAAMTALQALRGYPGSIEGKTVFVPAGCRFPPNCTVVRQKLTLWQ